MLISWLLTSEMVRLAFCFWLIVVVVTFWPVPLCGWLGWPPSVSRDDGCTRFIQVQAWAGIMEILECPVTRTSLLALLAGSGGKASWYGWCQCSCRSCRKVLQCLTVRLWVSNPDFLSGFTPFAFDQPRSTCKAAADSFRYLTHSWDPYRCYHPGPGWT